MIKCYEVMTGQTLCKDEICCLECEKVKDCKNVCSYVEFDKFTKENVSKCIFSSELD